MENKIKIQFKKENEEIELKIINPDLAELIHKIVAKNLEVTKENVEISTDQENFDTDELIDILVSVHEDFCDEIEKFFENIKEDVKTYYEDGILGDEIIKRIKEENIVE